jgi:hypothetical protein
MNDASEKTVISAQVPTPLRDELASLAGVHGRSLSGEMRRAIELHLHLSTLSDVGGELPSLTAPSSVAPPITPGQSTVRPHRGPPDPNETKQNCCDRS